MTIVANVVGVARPGEVAHVLQQHDRRARAGSSRIRAMFQNSVPRVSSIPRWNPLFENGWHGKPAARTSACGTVHLRVGQRHDVAADIWNCAASSGVSLAQRPQPVVVVDRDAFRSISLAKPLATGRVQRGVEPTDPSEEVGERERPPVELHVRSLRILVALQ